MSYCSLILTTKLRVYHFQLSTLFYFLLKIILNFLYIICGGLRIVISRDYSFITNPIKNIYIRYSIVSREF